MISELKTILRISSSNSAYDTEILDLIEAARQDLALSGVSSLKLENDDDPLIKRAISVYVKAHFGYDNPDYERLLASYNMLKTHLTLSQEYMAGESL
jgi:uncharacterized phage protein (predicted DNA packaging)